MNGPTWHDAVAAACRNAREGERLTDHCVSCAVGLEAGSCPIDGVAGTGRGLWSWSTRPGRQPDQSGGREARCDGKQGVVGGHPVPNYRVERGWNGHGGSTGEQREERRHPKGHAHDKSDRTRHPLLLSWRRVRPMSPRCHGGAGIRGRRNIWARSAPSRLIGDTGVRRGIASGGDDLWITVQLEDVCPSGGRPARVRSTEGPVHGVR